MPGTPKGQNALSLFLCALVTLLDPGQGDLAEELCALSREIHTALIAGKIAECERELAQVKEHQERGWADPAYAERRAAELQAMIQTWKARKDAPPLCAPVVVSNTAEDTPQRTAASGAETKLSGSAPEETYTDLEIHIAPRDVNAGLYAVTAELDGEDKYYGTLQMGASDRETLFTKTDPVRYGSALFDALFRGDIHTAYAVARAKAPDGCLRLRLWIDHEAADLHALAWERLHYRRNRGVFRVATNAKLPFSRYFGLQQGEVTAIEGNVRMLCVVANPQNLDSFQCTSLDVNTEIANLRNALEGLHHAGMHVTFMPGRSGISPALRSDLEAAGYAVDHGPATLNRLYRALAHTPGYHIVHIVAHGTFSTRKNQGALLLEDESGDVATVTDAALSGQLDGLEHKPHLMFLAVCNSVARVAGEHPFVAIGPRLVQIGIPAVIAMQDEILVDAAQQLTAEFYPFLLEHGFVDKALNQARNVLTGDDSWSVPVLFMRLREGRLLPQSALLPAANSPRLPYNVTARQINPVKMATTSLPPNPFTDMLMIRDAARFVGREAELRRVRSLLRSGSVTLVGEPKIGKSSLMARLADIWRAENGGRVFGPLDCQGVLDCGDFFAELAKIIGLPATDDRRALRDALRITSGLLLIDEMDCAPGWGLTDNDFALFRAVCSANPSFQLLVVSRTPLKMLFPDARRGSPAYNFLLPCTLGELSDADAHALLTHPWDKAAPAFDAATVDALLALAGTHPFKLQRAAHHCYEALRDPEYDWQMAYRDEIVQVL